MAYYLVRGKIREGLAGELRRKVLVGSFRNLRPFGEALTEGLRDARLAEDGRWIWEEVDHCSPPLLQEREAVLDRYFLSLEIEPVHEGDGWRQVEHLPKAVA